MAESEGDTLLFYPYLVARGPGELAATWFSGAGESLRWQVSKMHVGDSGTPPQMVSSARLTADRWRTDDVIPGAGLERDTAGEHITVLVLQDGDLAVVSPIRNPETNHFGFSFWTFTESSK